MKNLKKIKNDEAFLKKVRAEIERLQELINIQEDAVVAADGGAMTDVISPADSSTSSDGDINQPTIIDTTDGITSVDVLGTYKPGGGLLSQTNNYTLPQCRHGKKQCKKRTRKSKN